MYTEYVWFLYQNHFLCQILLKQRNISPKDKEIIPLNIQFTLFEWNRAINHLEIKV